MSSANLLPEGFESLSPFVEQWAIDRSCDRLQARLNSSYEEREVFFEAGKGLAEPALALLGQKPSKEYSEQEARLMNLVLTLAHIAQAVEIQRDDEDFHAGYAKYITISHSAADR
ncbi:hypothetical protein [Halioxenophilus sp. WMMB6]|uniref:hypothetical protein n=1 Tax=Halioxenophilus sp. WMMB6 TaxID=3073815 RepID=UPI00295ED212|nr:hypothetical protein [Halioxenophilus sp. WMMB6]